MPSMPAPNAATIDPRQVHSPWAERFEYQLARWTGFTVSKRRRIYERLARFCGNGYPLEQALLGITARLERAKDPRRAVWRQWLRAVREGIPLSTATADVLPPAERVLLSAGEQTGALDVAFREAAYVAGAGQRLKEVIVGAMAYPAILVLMLAALLVFLSLRLMPAMAEITPVDTWPAVSRNLHDLAIFIRIAGAWVALGLVLVAVVVMATLPRWQDRVRRRLDHWLPPWTIYREYQGATFLLAMSALTKAGVPIDDALTRIRKIASPWLRWYVDMMYRALKGAGENPGRAIDMGLLHHEVVGELQDYAAAGSFVDALEHTGRTIVEDTIKRIEVISAWIRGVLLALVAGMVVWVYAAIGMVVLEVHSRNYGVIN